MARIKRGNTPRIQFGGSPIEREVYWDVQVYQTGEIAGRGTKWPKDATRVRRSADMGTGEYAGSAGYGSPNPRKPQWESRGNFEHQPIAGLKPTGWVGQRQRTSGVQIEAGDSSHWKTVATARTEQKALKTAKAYENIGKRVRIIRREP